MAWPKGRSRKEFNSRAASPKHRSARRRRRKALPAVLTRTVQGEVEALSAYDRARVAVHSELGAGYQLIEEAVLSRMRRDRDDAVNALATLVTPRNLEVIARSVIR